MKTPIFEFVRQYADSDVSRFHMPGHKGQPFLGCEAIDITEVNGADVLYDADGIIAESEQNATDLFHTAHSFYSTEGSSLCIKAMLALVTTDKRHEKPLILAARNVHKAFIYACALLDLDVAWIYPKENEHLCSCHVTAEDVEKTIKTLPRIPAAVYVTSPDYLGQMLDIKKIADVCHRYGVPLLVDNAHGAYLHFLQPSKHPIALGADLCCDSAHKTLPVLTGGAYLHVSQNANENYCKQARGTLSLFASTSPSYLILQSLDLCNRYLADGYEKRLQECLQKTERVKQSIRSLGFPAEESEPLKLVWNARAFGYTGVEMASIFRANRIEVEFADDTYLVLMVTPETRDVDFDRLVSAFAGMKKKAEISGSVAPQAPKLPHSAYSIREAIFSPHESIPIERAEGRICASPTVSCPPAIPIVISGEILTEDAIRALEYYKINTVDVVK